ncbi:MAG: transposase [Candidatus Thiodiazotropha sp.]
MLKIDRWYPSSKICSCCGQKQGTMPLDIRQWQCSCGAVHERDINAAGWVHGLCGWRQASIF